MSLHKHPHSLVPGQTKSLHLLSQTGLSHEWHSTLRGQTEAWRCSSVCSGRSTAWGTGCVGYGAVWCDLRLSIECGSLAAANQWLQYIFHYQMKADKSSKWWTIPIRESGGEKEKKCEGKMLKAHLFYSGNLVIAKENKMKGQYWIPAMTS